MAVHELALLVTYYGVKGDNIAKIEVDKKYSSCQTLKGPSKGGRHTDFDAIGFTLTTSVRMHYAAQREGSLLVIVCLFVCLFVG